MLVIKFNYLQECLRYDLGVLEREYVSMCVLNWFCIDELGKRSDFDLRLGASEFTKLDTS